MRLVTSFDGHVGGGFCFSQALSGESLSNGQVGLVTFPVDIQDVLYVDEQPGEEREDGALTQQEYLDGAAALFRNPNAYRSIATDDTIQVYDPVFNLYGGYNPDGGIKTYFSPTGRGRYFEGLEGNPC